jgi:hypothetical protein
MSASCCRAGPVLGTTVWENIGLAVRARQIPESGLPRRIACVDELSASLRRLRKLLW